MTGSEFFIYGLLVLGWILFNVIQQTLRQRRQDRENPLPPDEPEPEAWEAQALEPPPAPQPVPQPLQRPPPFQRRAEEALRDLGWGRRPPPAPAASKRREFPPDWRPVTDRPAETPAPLPHRRPRREPVRWRPRTQDDLRHAMVAMTVLGPCRALEPYQPPGQAASPEAR